MSYMPKPSSLTAPTVTCWQSAIALLPSGNPALEGSSRFWAVPADSGDIEFDFSRGEVLAEQTLRLCQQYDLPSGTLAKVLAAADPNTYIGKGFLAAIEEYLLVKSRTFLQ